MSPKVSIIIPTYLASNQKYLDVCLDSIANLDYPKESLDVVLVASNGFEPTIPAACFSLSLKRICTPERLHYASAINRGVEAADADSSYYFLVSDDVILTKDSLREFVDSAGGANAVLGPISNCDNGTMHSLTMGFTKGAVFNQVASRQYRYADWEPFFGDLMNAKSLYPKGLIKYPWLCFYAVLIPRKVWHDVGGLDENFKSGQEDLDFCLRAERLGYPCLVALSSLIWHFSGVTADQVLTNEVRASNEKYYKEKWQTPC